MPVAGSETKPDTTPSVHLPAPPPLPEVSKPKPEDKAVKATPTEPVGIPTVIAPPTREIATEIVSCSLQDNKPYWAAQGETLREIARKTLGDGERRARSRS